ncbi:F-box/LRR-repeat protein At4g14103-like isoform X1 [Silene latifolia]|uniref:F-box/LRR-repeat protein At4g14103-like isoform X1 n=2 Tax=Silene latifolia TaxID=37657 RepID=UPI003D7868BC
MEGDDHGSSVKSMDWNMKWMKRMKRTKRIYASTSVLMAGRSVKGMDWNMKKRFTSRPVSKKACCSVDRLTSLPDELVSRILSMLPTKDVVATQVLCKKMRRLAFWITSVDLDDSPLSHCRNSPHLPDRFPLFASFVDHVFNNLSHPLTRFRLHLGGDKSKDSTCHTCYRYGVCFPDLQPSRLYTWITYPLAHHGLRELDISFHVSYTSRCQFPPQLFTCQSLEVLKLDSNLNLDGAEISLISLPNLKRLHLYSFLIVRDDFLTKLVSSCPSLEDLECGHCQWTHSDRLAVSSPSLRRLVLIIFKHGCDDERNSNLVVIDTPNLQYFHYDDNLAFHYSITNMNALIQANLSVALPLQFGSEELSYQTQLSLVRLVSNVQHLSLLGCCVENIYFGGETKDRLPMFHNLKTLELGWNAYPARWDKTLLEILACSPNLETLAFPEGFFFGKERKNVEAKVADLEKQGWGSSETPLCFRSNLKRIMIRNYYGMAREFYIIKFLLQKASILNFLEIICFSGRGHFVPIDEVASTLMELPRASMTCSVRVL